MTTNNYITLTNSNLSLSKKFRVVMGTLAVVSHRLQTRKRTLTGKSDNQVGASYEGWAGTLRIHTEGDLAGYGLLSDLQTFFSYNNPAGSPSNIITLTDHLGVLHQVEMIGDLPKENLTPYLDGPQAAYLVSIAMEEA